MGDKVIVTGGAGVIGRAICRRLVKSGYRPIAADLPNALHNSDFGADRIDLVAMDVSDRDSIAEAVTSVVADGETVAGLVNCAGILRDSFLGELDEVKLELMFQVNIAGMARVTDVVAPLLTEGSAIVNIGSLTGH
ncbi:SDR family oxidoreductase, partial [Mycolicibacterium sp. CBMA 334]